ncbi:MAG: carboxymuconolactone decarboxylase family protein [Acidobacteria bacterium]|jgi:alkylhydroperoxidase/carboxymuconolactone decarboxylase family protein YurZ|nr:carboxymuconolactone decarboxylase family protein [Acidobacteriota bacterium]MBE3125412.1 carboxymuconolactone decarboxylase family protein [Acidobacteriota bacterium]MBE3130635.1 carboxymuconolactone decarboxylase family protein [Acidobacteriota bacterium]
MPDHPLSTMRKLDPEFMKHLEDTDALVYAEGALPRRVKLLMAMAFDAAHGAPGGVRALAEQALKAGATKEEIAEALRVAFHLSGVGSLYAASFGLKDVLC